MQNINDSKIDKLLNDAQLLLGLQGQCVAMFNGEANNQLTNINTNSVSPTICIITGNDTIEKGTLKAFIDKYSELKEIRTSILKLLDTFTIYLTKQNTYRGNIEKIKIFI